MDTTSCDISVKGDIYTPSKKQLQEYTKDVQRVANQIKGLSKKQINFKVNAKEWNIRQVILHLADTEMFFCERIRKIIVEEKPLLQSFDQDDFAKALFYDKQDDKLAFDLLKTQRKSTVGLLKLLPSGYWKRKGIRDEKIVTLYDIFLIALHHIPTHLEQIYKIKSDPQFPSK